VNVTPRLTAPARRVTGLVAVALLVSVAVACGPSLGPGDPPLRASETAWMVRFLLGPVTVLILAVGAWGAWKARRVRGLALAALVGCSLALFCIRPVLGQLSTGILMGGPQFRDGLDAACLLACLADAVPHASDVCTAYEYPSGAYWTVTGPSWLGYLLVLPVVWVWNAVAAHNLGVALGLALLGLCSWLLARDLGAGPRTALLAMGGAVLAPCIVNELDKWSLDRTTLYLAPLYLLCLHRVAREASWRWPVLAGVALAATFYGQTYYGIYLLVATPLLVLPRLVGPAFHLRLLRLTLVPVLAVALMVPGLILLKKAFPEEASSSSESLWEVVENPLAPLDRETVELYFQQLESDDDGRATTRMTSPRLRLAGIIHRSPYASTLGNPALFLSGERLFWPLMLLALFAARRRGRFAVAAADVFILLLFALGPFPRGQGERILMVPLPYYFGMLAVPGFEALREVQRFGMLAASIAPVPLALGLAGLHGRLCRWVQGARAQAALAWVLTALGLLVLLVLPTLWGPGRGTAPTPGSTMDRLEARLIPQPGVLASGDWRLPEGLERAPAIFLPTTASTHPVLELDAARLGWPLVNPPPFGQASGELAASRRPIGKENGFLGRLDQASQGGPVLKLGGGISPEDLAQLRRVNIRYVVLYRSLARDDDAVTRTEGLISEQYVLLAEDEDHSVWGLP